MIDPDESIMYCKMSTGGGGREGGLGKTEEDTLAAAH